MLIRCQRQFSGFWHRHIHISKLFFYKQSFSLLLSFSAILTCLSPTAPSRLPLHLPRERCPHFSHDRSVPCRFELHILPLFKVTDCCMPNSPLKHFPMTLSHSLQHKAHTHTHESHRSNTILSYKLHLYLYMSMKFEYTIFIQVSSTPTLAALCVLRQRSALS